MRCDARASAATVDAMLVEAGTSVPSSFSYSSISTDE
jgi:hypothetical protein